MSCSFEQWIAASLMLLAMTGEVFLDPRMRGDDVKSGLLRCRSQ